MGASASSSITPSKPICSTSQANRYLHASPVSASFSSLSALFGEHRGQMDAHRIWSFSRMSYDRATTSVPVHSRMLSVHERLVIAFRVTPPNALISQIATGGSSRPVRRCVFSVIFGLPLVPVIAALDKSRPSLVRRTVSDVLTLLICQALPLILALYRLCVDHLSDTQSHTYHMSHLHTF